VTRRCLAGLRIYPGRETELDRRLGEGHADLRTALTATGLSDVTVFRRGTDAWLYARAEPGPGSPQDRLAGHPGFRDWLTDLRDVVVDAESPRNAATWYDEVFHTDAAPPSGPVERGLFSLVIDPHRAAEYDDLHAHAWPDMIAAIHRAGYRDYSGFRRRAQVVYVGRYHPDMPTVLRNIAATEVAARWSRALEGVIVAITDADGRHFTGREVFHQD
jgi:L-rhamnose mutarotase